MQSPESYFTSSIFSDETPQFLILPEKESGELIRIRIRLQRGARVKVYLLLENPIQQIEMKKIHVDSFFDWYEASVPFPGEPLYYSFLISWRRKFVHYLRTGVAFVPSIPKIDWRHSFRYLPGLDIPEWSKGAIQYQIFPDRFCKGNPTSDVLEGEYIYNGTPVHHMKHWTDPIRQDDFRCFYGGDLEGILQKLDYLQSLGVKVLYLNPIFVSPSSHGYDTQDYRHIDPHLTVIQNDLPHPEHAAATSNNRTALQYILRTTDSANLEASDACFASFCQEVHRRGMKIILDGVFNHCGSFHQWLNREGLYGNSTGAFGHPDSPFRNYFRFTDEWTYENWWGVDTLPKLNYESSTELCEEILEIAEKWVSPPYSVDGWRLDVAADLGHSPKANHAFWKRFRQRVKAANPNAVILAEHYGDPFDWLQGDEWDTVMNYDAFMEPLTFFLTGMEKHSDSRRDDLYQNGEAFFKTMIENMSRFSIPSLQCAMNQLSNHDHSRFLTRTNRRTGRLHDKGSKAASEGISKAVFKEAVCIQMTWPGAPTLYYGDEAGLTGWTDPDNRRPFPWGQEDQELIQLHRALAALRRELPVLIYGSLKPLCAGHGTIAYARFNSRSSLAVACNNTAKAVTLSLPLWEIGIPDGTQMISRFSSSGQAPGTFAGTVRDGMLSFIAPPHCAAVLVPNPAS